MSTKNSNVGKGVKSPAPDNTAVFYTQKDYAGSEYPYEQSDKPVECNSGLNDAFYSVRVGAGTKVYMWEDHLSGRSGEADEDTPDLEYIGGISWFKVTHIDTNGIYIKFINNIPNDDDTYTLTLKVSEDIGETTVPSGADYHQLVGIINDTASHVTQVAVRNSSGVYIANGSCYFNEVDGDVICDTGDNFPPNMSVSKDENGFFDFSINASQ